MDDKLTLLGIESSCDDTAAAVLHCSPDFAEVLSTVVHGQYEVHGPFGGVVPELAARAHVEKLDEVTQRALDDATLNLADVDGIAVTAGPGLIGGVLAGVMFAKGLAKGAGKPLIGVNHLAGHALTPRFTNGLAFPYLMLLVSGGHCQFLTVAGPTEFRRLGGTIDDAPGEAFDKTARLLGLPQPGGPSVEAEASSGDETRFVFPRPLLDREGCDMSFSGLKTALLRARDQIVAENRGLPRQARADLCIGFQVAVRDVLTEKSRRAVIAARQAHPNLTGFAVAGGVAANLTLRKSLSDIAEEAGLPFIAPPLEYCTDNAAMIAWAGSELLRGGISSDMTLAARPRWPLDNNQPSMLGSGKKGAKA
jgi:N6-L-threonylcarbamoyladenine synthase